MKNISVVIGLLCYIAIGCGTQQSEPPSQNDITTLILLRHAEKENDGTKDPGLTEEGIARASELVRVFDETQIDAVYSTAYKRTTATVEPLAGAKGLTISNYEPMNGEAMDKILQANAGKTVVISGHSNTTPWVANYFLGNESLSDFKDSDYDNIIILTVLAKGNAKVTWINYGEKTD